MASIRLNRICLTLAMNVPIQNGTSSTFATRNRCRPVPRLTQCGQCVTLHVTFVRKRPGTVTRDGRDGIRDARCEIRDTWLVCLVEPSLRASHRKVKAQVEVEGREDAESD